MTKLVLGGKGKRKKEKHALSDENITNNMIPFHDHQVAKAESKLNASKLINGTEKQLINYRAIM